MSRKAEEAKLPDFLSWLRGNSVTAAKLRKKMDISSSGLVADDDDDGSGENDESEEAGSAWASRSFDAKITEDAVVTLAREIIGHCVTDIISCCIFLPLPQLFQLEMREGASRLTVLCVHCRREKHLSTLKVAALSIGRFCSTFMTIEKTSHRRRLCTATSTGWSGSM